MPLNNPQAYKSPAQSELAAIDDIVGDVPGLPAHHAEGLRRIAGYNKGKIGWANFIRSAMRGEPPEAAWKMDQVEKAIEAADGAGQQFLKTTEGMNDDEFMKALDDYRNKLDAAVGLRPRRVELEDPNALQLGLGILSSLALKNPQASMNALAVPFQYQLAERDRKQALANEDYERDFNQAMAKAKNAGEVVDLLSRRQEKEFDAQNKQVQSWRDVYNNPSASLEQRRNAWQVLKEQYGENLPEPQSKTSLEIQREASATRSLAAAKYSEVRAEDLQATRPARLAEIWSDVDLNARRGALTDSQKALVDKRVENYQEEIDIRWANVNSRYALAMAQLEALESYRAASLAQGETRIAMDYMRQMQDVVNRVNPEDQADLQEARDEVSRLDKEISEADVQLRIANTSKDKAAEDAWYAAKTALIAQRRQARDAKRAIEARIAEARRDMQERIGPLQVAPSSLSPGTPNPQATGKMPPPLPN